MNVEKFIAKFKNLELVEMYIPVKEELKKNMFHRRVKNKDNPKYFIDYWHTGKFRALDGSFQHSGYEDKALRIEIEKLAGYREKTEPIEEQETHGQIVTFGKHKGERWTRVPVSYLRWLANESYNWRGMANAELKRRGTTIDSKVEISGHALDRASLNCRRIWHETSEEGEGIHAWLIRMATEAIESKGEVDFIRWKGLKLAFSYGEYYPTLKTVMPYKDDLSEKATISLAGLVLWLKQRKHELDVKKGTVPVKEKRYIGTQAVVFKQIIGYIEAHLGGEKDIALEESDRQTSTS